MDGTQRSPQAPALVGIASPVQGAEAGAHVRTLPFSLTLRRLATPSCILALLVLGVTFFWKVAALRQVLLPADILYAHDPLWTALAPHDFSRPANPLDSDALTEFYPWTALAAAALHRGVIPLWNPYSFAGTPFLGAMQTAVFYPINLILEWFSSPLDVLGLRALIHLVAALCGAFLFARRLDMSRPAALLAALTFGFGLPYIAWIEHPMAGAITWLPWLLICVDGIVISSGGVWWTAAAGGVLVVDVLAGHGETTAHLLLLCAAYAVFRGVVWRRAHATSRILRTIVAFGVMLVLGLGISAIYLVPTLAQLPLSEATSDRAATAAVMPLGDPAGWKTLVVAIIPDFFGNPTWRATPWPLNLGYNEAALYTGTVPFVLALLAVTLRRSAQAMFFAAVALAALGMAVKLPLLGMLDNLPILHLAANGRLRFEYAFAVAMLAGFGLDSLRVDGVTLGTVRLFRLWTVTVAALAVVAVVGLVDGREVGVRVPIATAIRAAQPALWLALFVTLVWLHVLGRLPKMVVLWVAIALAAADLTALGIGYHATVSRATAAVVPPAIRAVQSDHSVYRVAGLGNALLPSMSSLYGLHDIRGYDPAYSAAYERYFAGRFGMRGTRLTLAPFGPSPAQARALSLLNVKYIFASCSVRLNLRYYVPVYRGAGCVYRNTAVLPRAMLVHSWRAASPDRAEAWLDQGTVDPRHVAVVGPPSSANAPGEVRSRARGSERVQVIADDDNNVIVRLYGARAGLLVLADAYVPGWQAQVDGRDVAVIRADAILRAVAVGPGSHTVSFTYRPDSFVFGATLSAASAAIAAGVLLFASLRGVYAKRRRVVPGTTV